MMMHGFTHFKNNSWFYSNTTNKIISCCDLLKAEIILLSFDFIFKAIRHVAL